MYSKSLESYGIDPHENILHFIHILSFYSFLVCFHLFATSNNAINNILLPGQYVPVNTVCLSKVFSQVHTWLQLLGVCTICTYSISLNIAKLFFKIAAPQKCVKLPIYRHPHPLVYLILAFFIPCWSHITHWNHSHNWGFVFWVVGHDYDHTLSPQKAISPNQSQVVTDRLPHFLFNSIWNVSHYLFKEEKNNCINGAISCDSTS